MRTSSWKPNYGDMLVCAAILRQIKAKETVGVGFGYKLTQPVDVAVMRGSTYLSNEMNFDDAIKTVDSIDCNIACIGLGAQNADDDVTFLDNNEKAKEFVQKLSEKSKSISVRGYFTADIVKRLGGKNIRVTGCPSMFYFNRQNPVFVTDTLNSAYRRLGISIHSALGSRIFCRDPKLAKALHGDVIRFALENAPLTKIFEQGIPKEFAIADRSEDFQTRIEAAKGFLREVGLKDAYDPLQIICAFSSIVSIEDWLGKARELDAAIGFRFHGNMVALNQGIPCFYYTYDSRLEEFCDLYDLPSQPIEAGWIDPVKAMLDHDWDSTNKAVRKCQDEVVKFYQENGVENNIEAVMA
ncbi:polysaccharide pyruvyl transferase family protein [Pseudoroseomonas ludipueritiae]|uniref:Polysaccharide pyruvyl transferase family protein n=1 Tax=Pseudoroseomonas ludipueritiae TaxID=198093 RepID=A0ABR7RDA8_9PROT|nr:polysaccharide pyruvyl transferase family protein [Pseudoroseomonas ludipueritiae]MBC9179827.1 polysaccharide pyruvyl transferase family protein [Pseudoroseomonas ludipueritiae]